MKRLLIISALCIVPLFGVECSESTQQQQMTQWQTLGALMEQNIIDTQNKLHLVTDPVDRAAMQARLDKMREISSGFNTTLAGITVVDDPAPGDAGLGATEAALTMLAGVTGGASLLAVPFIRLFRQRKQIFQAVDAGGGVVDVSAAKLKLVENQGAWKALQKHQANGGHPAEVKKTRKAG